MPEHSHTFSIYCSLVYLDERFKDVFCSKSYNLAIQKHNLLNSHTAYITPTGCDPGTTI